MVETDGTQGQYSGGERTRRFEARWIKEETVGEIVQAAWACASAMGQAP